MKFKSLFVTIIVILTFLLPCFAQENTPEEYIVKVVYFVPKDREHQKNIDTKIRELLKGTQKFYANQMENYGYDRKTFRLETDANGDINTMLVDIGMTENTDLDDVTSYALITLVSKTDQPNVMMKVGSDDSIKVWLNSEVVFNNATNRNYRENDDAFSVNLKKGDNRLLVKVSEREGAWGMHVGVGALEISDFGSGCLTFCEYGLLRITGMHHGACCFRHSPDFTDCADYMSGDAKLFCIWTIAPLCTVILQIASLYRPLPDCVFVPSASRLRSFVPSASRLRLGDSTNWKFMFQNACEFGVLRDSDNTCQKLYTPHIDPNLQYPFRYVKI